MKWGESGLGSRVHLSVKLGSTLSTALKPFRVVLRLNESMPVGPPGLGWVLC